LSLLSTTALSVSIAGNLVCRDLGIRIAAGSRWAILGRNGVGKTTLLKTLAGLHAADGGAVLLAGTPLAAWPRRVAAQKIGVLFQDQHTLFPGTVLETVLIGRHPYITQWRWEDE
jgi:iron complex transport system ATP-binding protein